MEWVLVICLGFSDVLGTCGQVRQARYASYADCARERFVVSNQPRVALAYCRPVREPELVR